VASPRLGRSDSLPVSLSVRPSVRRSVRLRVGVSPPAVAVAPFPPSSSPLSSTLACCPWAPRTSSCAMRFAWSWFFFLCQRCVSHHLPRFTVRPSGRVEVCALGGSFLCSSLYCLRAASCSSQVAVAPVRALTTQLKPASFSRWMRSSDNLLTAANKTKQNKTTTKQHHASHYIIINIINALGWGERTIVQCASSSAWAACRADILSHPPTDTHTHMHTHARTHTQTHTQTHTRTA
jgi:hypothetical protein